MRTVITDDGPRPQLKYFDGATCPEDKTQELATQIDFRCDPRAGKVSGFHSFLLGDHRIHIFMDFFFRSTGFFVIQRARPYLPAFWRIVRIWSTGRQMSYVNRSRQTWMKKLVKFIIAN